jgi:hypothetical protein
MAARGHHRAAGVIDLLTAAVAEPSCCMIRWPQAVSWSGQLVVGQRLDVGALGQQVDGLLAGGHEVARLRPRDVDRLVAPDLGQLQVVRVEAAAGQLLGVVAQVGQQPVGGQADQVAVLPADHGDAALAGLGLGADAVLQGALLLAQELDLAPEPGQDGRAHLLGLLDRLELGRDQDQRPFALLLERLAPAATCVICPCSLADGAKQSSRPVGVPQVAMNTFFSSV